MADLNINVQENTSVVSESLVPFTTKVHYVDYVNGNDANDGLTWGTAKKRVNGLSTVLRGDEVRLAKSPDPVSLSQNVVFTDKSESLSLASAVTLTVDDCDSAWTASVNVTQATDTTNVKEGSSARALTVATAFTTGLVAYRASGSTIDFSSYTKITFWIKVSVAVTASYLKISLCSDNAGATPVDDFTIPYKLEAGRWYPITLARNGGGALGNAIQSVAVYGLTDLPATVIYLDNIEACNGFSLQSLIGKSNTDTDEAQETWWAIRSIKGTSVKLGANTQQGTASTNFTKYYGVGETVTGYYRNCIIVAEHLPTTTSSISMQWLIGGSNNGTVKVSGGWNTATNTKDGYSFFDGLNGWGLGLSTGTYNYLSFSRIGCVRFYRGFAMSNLGYAKYFDLCAISCSYGGIELGFGSAQWMEFVPYDVDQSKYGIKHIRCSQIGLETQGIVFQGWASNIPLKDVVIFCFQGYGISVSSNYTGLFFKKLTIRGSTTTGSYPVLGSDGPYRCFFEDIDISDNSVGMSFTGGGFTASVFRNGKIKNNGNNNVSLGGHGEWTFDGIEFGGTTYDIYQQTTGAFIQVYLYNCTGLVLSQNMAMNLKSFIVAYNYNGTGLNKSWRNYSNVASNTSIFKTASPSVEFAKVVVQQIRENSAQLVFVAPLEYNVARTLKIWLKRSSTWTAYRQDEWHNYPEFLIGVRVGGKFAVPLADITSQLSDVAFTQFTLNLPQAEARFDGVCELVLIHSGNGAGNTNFVYADDFEWS